MLKFSNYAAMNAAYKFEEKAGFNLEPSQVAAVDSLSAFQRSGNFSDVGCGKTVMATAISMMKAVDSTVVTVPPILIPQWAAWLSQFGEKVVTYRGTPRERDKMDLTTARWVVVSHAIFRDDFNKLSAAMANKTVEVIVDEAQFLKNSGSVLYRCVSKMIAGQHCQLLTGTPTTKPVDAYSYIKIKTPTAYRSLGHFENVHVAERDFFKQPTKFQNLDVLAKHLAVQTVKFTKAEVFGYNLDPIYQTMPYDLHPKHAALYEKLVNEQLLLLDSGEKIDATTAQRLYHALQQIVCNWGYFSGEPSNQAACYEILNSVIEDTATLDKSHSKLIVWTYYKMTTASVLSYINNKWPGVAVAAYSGADSNKSVSAFMEDPETRILVAQPASAGMGLNPAHLCSEMLFLEASTSPMQIRQAIGRVDRKGQKVRPTIRFAAANGTIQHYLYRRLSENDDLVVKVENLKDSLRAALLGR